MKWRAALASLLLGFGGLFFVLAFLRYAVIGAPQAGSTVSVTIPLNTDTEAVAELLARERVLSSPAWYLLYGWLDGAVFHPKAGTYALLPGMSFRALARALSLGPQRRESQARLIEGWTVDEEIEYLREEKGIAATTTSALIGRSVDRVAFDPSLRFDFSFLRFLPRRRSLEGYLFPETYRVWDDQLPEGLVRKQLQEFERRFGQLMPTAASSPLKNLDDIVTLASIVEREVRDPADRKIVAGIFLRRLQDGIGLQSDATLTYALDTNRSRATNEDLASPSPYNTYKHRGLPPSPICNPSEPSIRAVLEPTPSPYRFFLTDREGRVIYARTFEEHIQNRQRVGY